MSDNKPNWMIEEEERAEDLADTGKTANDTAPQLVRVTKEPPRMQKAFYIQQKYADAFDDFVFKQKKLKNGLKRKKAPQLAEEALKMLLQKYGEDVSDL